MERDFAGYLDDYVPNRPQRATPLTDEEVETLTCYSHGLERPHVADVLGVSPETVKSRVVTARRKLAAKNVTHAVAVAFRIGLIA